MGARLPGRAAFRRRVSTALGILRSSAHPCPKLTSFGFAISQVCHGERLPLCKGHTYIPLGPIGEDIKKIKQQIADQEKRLNDATEDIALTKAEDEKLRAQFAAMGKWFKENRSIKSSQEMKQRLRGSIKSYVIRYPEKGRELQYPPHTV